MNPPLKPAASAQLAAPRATAEGGEVSPGSSFGTTHWSLVLLARDKQSPQAQQALAELCRTYWYPLYAEAERLDLPICVHAANGNADLMEILGNDRQNGTFLQLILPVIGAFLSLMISEVPDRYPRLRFTDSEYHGAGLDQMMISGPAGPLVRCLDDERVAEAARRMAEFMMGSGRVMHWKGHNPLLADHALGRA